MPPKTHGHDTRFMKLQKNNCFVCGMNNPEGMRLKFILDEERQTFICRFRLGNAGEMRGNAGTGNAGTEMRGQTGRSPFFDRHRFARFPVNWGTSRLSPGFLAKNANMNHPLWKCCTQKQLLVGHSPEVQSGRSILRRSAW